MSKDNLVYINHIISGIKKISSYTKGLDEDSFNGNSLVQDAVIRQFEIIGEATKRVSKEFREKHPKIPWLDMAGMRDNLIHDYLNVDIGILWKTIIIDIPKLKKLLENLNKRNA
jgi:uncharacterized protein with HEPN domain